MLRTQFIEANKEAIKKSLLLRNWKEENLSIVDEILELDIQRKSTQTELEAFLAQTNALSKEIGAFFKNGERDKAEAAKQQVSQIKEKSESLSTKLNQIKSDLESLLLQVPNLAHDSVPAGKSDEDNQIYQDWEKDLPKLIHDAKSHWELAEQYDIIDFKTGALIAGSGFPLFKGKGAKLQRALINFCLDQVTEAGYLEVIPPLLVNEDSARATGQLPDKEGQMYHVTKDNLYLIPTAEVPVTNIYRNKILKTTDFPIKLTGYTPCFRREAGSYGSDVKGLNRLHQFDKIEIVQIRHPENSYQALEEMIEVVASMLQKLELPYRVLRLCGGDLTFASALTFDFETYSAAQKKWLEVSSVSNFETFQSNRLKLRFKDDQGNMNLAHTLNGSAFGLARIMATILENYQTSDGIEVPNVLRSYTGFDKID